MKSMISGLINQYNEKILKAYKTGNAAFWCAKIGKLMFFFVITIPIGLLIVIAFLILKIISSSYMVRANKICKCLLYELIIKNEITDLFEIDSYLNGIDYLNVLEKMLKRDERFKKYIFDSTGTKLLKI